MYITCMFIIIYNRTLENKSFLNKCLGICEQTDTAIPPPLHHFPKTIHSSRHSFYHRRKRHILFLSLSLVILLLNESSFVWVYTNTKHNPHTAHSLSLSVLDCLENCRTAFRLKFKFENFKRPFGCVIYLLESPMKRRHAKTIRRWGSSYTMRWFPSLIVWCYVHINSWRKCEYRARVYIVYEIGFHV